MYTMLIPPDYDILLNNLIIPANDNPIRIETLLI
jgi:hypothetical protein